MIGALLGATQIGFGLYDAYKGRKEAKRAGRRADQQFELMRQAQERNHALMDEELSYFRQRRQEADQRYREFYQPIEQRIAEEMAQDPDIEGQVDEATGDFIGSYDRALDAQRREMSRRGLANTSQAARMEEDAAFNRARGEASIANQARSTAEDKDFARRIAFLGSGQGLYNQANSMFNGRYDVDPSLYKVSANEAAQSATTSGLGFQAAGEAAAALGNMKNSKGQNGFQQLAGLFTGRSAKRDPDRPGLNYGPPRGGMVGDASRPNFNRMTGQQQGIQTGMRQGVYGGLEVKKRAY